MGNTLDDLIKQCVKLSDNGDFHLEHLYDRWQASCCWIEEGDSLLEDDTHWFHGKTSIEAVEKLLTYLTQNQ